MYAVALWIRPTSALTFRILPGSLLDIATYPFIPPTTLSGWLRRLFWAKEGLLPPDLRAGNAPKFYVLPRHLRCLGAYPVGGWRIHRTYRHGPRSFTHDSFSRLRVQEREELQLHTWEYLLADSFLGVVLAPHQEELEPFKELEGYGFKLGKEGFAFLERVGDPVPVEAEEHEGLVLTPVRAENWSGEVQGAYPLYRFVYDKDRADPAPNDTHPSPVKGYEGAYFVLPKGEGVVKGFSLENRLFSWDLVEFYGGDR